MLDADQIREVEPHARGLRALLSPQTAIVDFPGVTEALARELAEAGGRVRLGTEVQAVVQHGREVVVGTTREREAFDLVITCAGLQSDRVAARSGESRDPRIVPFYGDYFLLKPAKRALVNGLIYPVPDPRYPFLGVHLTKRVDGEVMLGPNAFLSLGREAYDRPRGMPRVVPRDLRDAVGFPGFWRFAAGNLTAAVRESRTALSSKAFVAEARRYVDGIGPDDVVRGPRGIRAQAMDASGRLVDDFVITGSERVVHVRNAPSPGATSALAIAEHIVAESLRRGDLGTPAERNEIP
jgi:L-2-hydroxyglutarate oxidase LhgO